MISCLAKPLRRLNAVLLDTIALEVHEAEAMLCGCTPVTSDRGAIPEVVGDSGFLVKYGDVQGIKNSIEKALASDGDSRARERVIIHFPLQKRREGLIKIIDECIREQ